MFYSKPWLDALIVLLVVLLFFGPKRLPELGRSLGHGLREFKDSITGGTGNDQADERPGISRSSQSSADPEQPVSERRESAEVGSSESRS